MKPVLNLDEVEFDDVEENGRYTSSRGSIGSHIGARKLGYNLTVLPPGKVQCPFHCHHGEEEMFLILEGEGELRFGDERYPIRKHDVIACPTGGPEVAHQIVNTGTTTMRYLALSTLAEVEACEYPDSGKVSVVTGQARRAGPAQDVPRREHGRLLRPRAGVRHWRDVCATWHHWLPSVEPRGARLGETVGDIRRVRYVSCVRGTFT